MTLSREANNLWDVVDVEKESRVVWGEQIKWWTNEKITYLEKDGRISIYNSLNMHKAYEALSIYWVENISSLVTSSLAPSTLCTGSTNKVRSCLSGRL